MEEEEEGKKKKKGTPPYSVVISMVGLGQDPSVADGNSQWVKHTVT